MRFTFLVQLYLALIFILIPPTCILSHKYLLIELDRVKNGRARILDPNIDYNLPLNIRYNLPAKNEILTSPPSESENAGGNERKQYIV